MLLWHLILIQVITFLVIILFLRLLFYRHLSSALTRLQELHQQNLEREVALNKELEKAKQQRQVEVEAGKDEARKIKDSARQEVEGLKEKMLVQARQEADRLLKEANQQCLILKEETVQRMEDSSIRLSFAMIKEIFSEKARQELERELVDELIEELRRVDKSKLKVDIKRAEITSSHPLAAGQKNAIKEVLEQAIGSSLEINERIDQEIISGLVINLGGLILDGSLSNKLRKIIPYLKNNDKA